MFFSFLIWFPHVIKSAGFTENMYFVHERFPNWDKNVEMCFAFILNDLFVLSEM